MGNKPKTLYGNSRELLEAAERKNELLAQIAGETYTNDGNPSTLYNTDKALLAAAQKENELLESIADGGGAGVGGNKIAIDYATDVISLKKGDTPIADSGATLPAYGLTYDSGTGGLTLTKNGTGMQGQTVSLPPYGAPNKAESAEDMTDTDKVYVYVGETTADLTNGNWYVYDSENEEWVSGGVYNAEAIVTDTTLSVSGAAADAKAVGDEITDVKTQLDEISEPGENIAYFTKFETRKYGANVYTYWVDKETIKIYGTLNSSWARWNLLNGNDEYTNSTPTFTTNLNAGTYTLKSDDDLKVYYGTSSDDKEQWISGTAITIENPVCVYLQSKSSTQNFGTSESPTFFHVSIYNGNVSIVPSAVDKAAREALAGMNNYDEIEEAVGETSYNKELIKADFDYTKKYNIFNGTTWTPDKRINYLNGNAVDEEGMLVTDYIEIDPTQRYLCVNIFVRLSGEIGTGLVTGANRIWQHNYWAFYDENKTYIRGNALDELNNTSKSIPATAKYVRLTIDSASVIPYAVLFYGNYQNEQDVRYVGYRKEIIQTDVYAATGMEKLNMVMFGDSITYGYGSTNPISYTQYVNDYLRSNVISVGLGGSRMSQGSPDEVGLGSFASLCENIVSTDANAWDALDAYALANHSEWTAQITKLKNIDWSKIHAIGLWYGANDWNNNVPVGSEYNEDPTQYDGACAYGLKTLLTKYSHLQVIIFTPMFRVVGDGNSDANNGAGLNMDAYGSSLQHVRTVFHCPIVDLGNEIGVNRYTIYTYSAESDGTHPRKVVGLERIGRFVAESIKRFIQPY